MDIMEELAAAIAKTQRVTQPLGLAQIALNSLAPKAPEPPVAPPSSIYPPGDGASLKEAIAWLDDRLEDGARCPCCQQYAKIYKRPLNSGMAAGLIVLYRKTLRAPTDGGWLHIPKDFAAGEEGLTVLLKNREYPKLRYWGLLEPEERSDDPDVPYTGKWRITELGGRFVRGEASVPKYVFLYDGEVLLRQNLERITIQTALGTKFSYAELMR